MKYDDYQNEYKHKGGVFRFLYCLVMWAVLFFCAFALVFAFKARKGNDEAITLFGKQFRVVLSNSMEQCVETDVSNYEIPSLPVNTMIAIEVVPEDEEEAKQWYASLKVGDILTFRYVYVRQETITHRITKITPKDEGYIIELQGDNKNSDADTLMQTIDTTLADSPNYVVGKVFWENHLIGRVISKVRTPMGIVCFIILPSMVLFIGELYVFIKRRLERDMIKRQQRFMKIFGGQSEGFNENIYFDDRW